MDEALGRFEAIRAELDLLDGEEPDRLQAEQNGVKIGLRAVGTS